MLHCYYIFVILMVIKIVKCSIYVSVNDRRKQASTSFSHVYSIERGSHILGCCFRLSSFTLKLLSEKISLKENVYSIEQGSHLSEKISLKEHELFFVNSIFKIYLHEFNIFSTEIQRKKGFTENQEFPNKWR